MGPLRVCDDDGLHSIGATKIQIALAVLLVRADQIVSVDQLMEEIWGEEPPRRASAGIHVYVSQIRKFLHRPGRADSPLLTRAPGYLLRLGSDEVDFRRFEELVKQGRQDARDHQYEQAAAVFTEALSLWRGPLLADLHCGPLLEGFRTWLEEVRLECLDALIECQLQLGRHRELVSDLYQLVTEYPLRETLHCHLMVALYRCGRRADALQVYQSARKTLNEMLGLEPCQDLQDVQRAILTSDQRLNLHGQRESTHRAHLARLSAVPDGWRQPQIAS
jgi:DNA-binding SARP family transcriptional activator